MSAEISAIQRIEQATSLRDSIERSLSAAIISGELAPGVLVSVPSLASQFEVSATPVREAMLNLGKRGFVEPVRNKGFRVTEVSEQDLIDIVAVRRLLEAPAMGMLAAKFPHEQLADFRIIADKIVSASSEADLATYLEADSVFHLSLLALCGNQRLVDLVADLRQQTRMIGLKNLIGTVELERSAQEHHILLDLLDSGNAVEVERLMYAHVGHVIGWWNSRPEAAEQIAPQ